MKLSKVQRELLREICRNGSMSEALYAGYERRTLSSLVARGLLHNDTLTITPTEEGRMLNRELMKEELLHEMERLNKVPWAERTLTKISWKKKT